MAKYSIEITKKETIVKDTDLDKEIFKIFSSDSIFEDTMKKGFEEELRNFILLMYMPKISTPKNSPV